MGAKDGLSIYVLTAFLETLHWNEMKKNELACLYLRSPLLKFHSLFSPDYSLSYMRGSRKFCQKGSNSNKFFLC